MPDLQFFDFLIVGNIATEFIIDLRNRAHQNVLGGSALYAAGAIRCWNDRIALSSHTHKKNQIPLQKIHNRYQIDLEGIQFHNDFPDDRVFLGYVSPYEVINANPVAFFSSRNIVFPKDLIGYTRKEIEDISSSRPKFLPMDIPHRYWDITAALICHADLETQLQLSSMLQQTAAKILIIQSSEQYMKMSNYETMPVLMKDTTSFITTVNQLLTLFQNRSHDIWEIAETLCSLGCEHLVMHDGHFGQYLFDRQTKKRFHIPYYPVDMVDPTGMMESFCGGFIAGIKINFDPLEALISGAVSASFTAEGIGPFYGVDAIPGLLQSRYKFARGLVKTI
jgi:hypothetical protein